MRRPIVGTLLLVVASVLFGSCGVTTNSSGSPAADRYQLPQAPAAWLRDPSCGLVDVTPLVLNGKLVDGIATVTANGTIPIAWPSGFSAIFTPPLVVLGNDGNPFARQGEDMTGTAWHGAMVCVVDVQPSTGKLAVWIAFPP
jgi:hypothetical protein